MNKVKFKKRIELHGRIIIKTYEVESESKPSENLDVLMDFIKRHENYERPGNTMD